VKDPIGCSILVFALGAFSALILVALSPAAALGAIAIGAGIAIVLAKSGPNDDGPRSL